jgi:hypothetical protein
MDRNYLLSERVILQVGNKDANAQGGEGKGVICVTLWLLPWLQHFVVGS